MSQKGLKKGDGVWGSGKKLSSKVFSRFSKNQALLKNYFRFISRSIPSSNVVGCGGQPGT